MKISKIIRKGIINLKKEKAPSKEVKRFKEIYQTVYTHARKKGQNHGASLRYCWNVYIDQAPDREKRIIRDTLRDKKMFSRNRLREMILKEMYMAEGDVIQMSDYAPEAEVDTAEEGSPFEMFLSKIHTEMMDFLDENFESISPEEGNFLDGLLDTIEEELGIDEEEGIEVGGDEEYSDDEEVLDDLEDED